MSKTGFRMNGYQRLILLRIQDALRIGRCSWPEDGRTFGLDVMIFIDDVKKCTTDAHEKTIIDNVNALRNITFKVPESILADMPSYVCTGNPTVEFKPFISITLVMSQRSISFVLDPRTEWLLTYLPEGNDNVKALSFKLMREFKDNDDERRLYEILHSHVNGFRTESVTISVSQLAFLMGYENGNGFPSHLLEVVKNTQYLLDKSKRSDFCFNFRLYNIDDKVTYRSARLKDIQFTFRSPANGTLNAKFKKPSFKGDTQMTSITMPVEFYKKMKTLSKRKGIRMNILFSEAVSEYLKKKGI